MSCVSSILFRELLTVRLLYRIIQYEVFKVQLLGKFYLPSGDGGIRTLDPLLARQVLSQLSYTPIRASIGFSIFTNGLKWTRTTDLTLIRRAL